MFIICPDAYYKANAEAKKYANFITYEECIDFFSKKTDTLSKIRCAQLNQAIEKGPGSTWEKNEKAMAFFEKYRAVSYTHLPATAMKVTALLKKAGGPAQTVHTKFTS